MKKKPWQQLDKYYNDLIGDEFLMKARYFRKVQVETPEQFELLAKHCKIDLRTAFYWAEIGRVFGELDLMKNGSARSDGRRHKSSRNTSIRTTARNF